MDLAWNLKGGLSHSDVDRINNAVLDHLVSEYALRLNFMARNAIIRGRTPSQLSPADKPSDNVVFGTALVESYETPLTKGKAMEDAAKRLVADLKS